jgi:hypothetical protein
MVTHHSGSKPDLQGSGSHSLLHHAENAIPPLLGDYDPFSVAQNPVEVITVMLVSRGQTSLTSWPTSAKRENTCILQHLIQMDDDLIVN